MRQIRISKMTIAHAAAVAALLVFLLAVVVAHPAPAPPPKVERLKACLESIGVDEAKLVERDDPLDQRTYEDLNFQWNRLHGQIEPLAFLTAEGVADISAGVRCSTQEGVRVVVLGGGHSYTKYGFGDNDSLIVDMRGLNRVQVDTVAMQATIDAGTRLGKVNAELWAAGGYMIPTGTCPTVGVTGLVLGGGFGDYSRLLGLAQDSLLELRMVDWQGTVLTVNTVENADLFWALRGGGGGSYGIVTSLKFKLHRVPLQIARARAEFHFDDFPHFWRAWQRLVTSDPPTGPTPPVGSIISMGGDVLRIFLWSMRYDTEGLGMADIEPILATFPTPTNLTIGLLTHTGWVLERSQPYSDEPLTEFAQLANLTRHNQAAWKKVKSMLVSKVLNDSEVVQLQDLFRSYLQKNPMFAEHYGGAVRRFAPTDTAYYHRAQMLYNIQLSVVALDGEEDREAMDAMDHFFEETKALLNHTMSYQNYADGDLSDYLPRYYGPNLERLVEVKRRVDPFNVFHHPQSIPLNIPE